MDINIEIDCKKEKKKYELSKKTKMLHTFLRPII